MYKEIKLALFVVLWLRVVGGVGIDAPVFAVQKPVDYVNPLIGTKGGGNVVPGPQWPHGMVKLSPDTISLPLGGYEYDDEKIIGFSHTHLEGTGGGAYGNILLMPTIGELRITEEGYASKFSHAKEIASPGYYAVVLEDYGIRVELTATEHAGFHKYTFPESKDAHILIDVGHALGSCVKGEVQIVDRNKIQGNGIYSPHHPASSQRYPIYFYAQFSRQFNSYGTWIGGDVSSGLLDESGNDIGAFVDYSTSVNETIKVKIGISSISVEQAQKNLNKEIPGWDFAKIRREAEEVWNKGLNRIEVEGGTGVQKIKFYTALYHSLLSPTDYTEYGYYYSPFSGKGEVFPADGKHFYNDDWCIWDTFRTTHPLQIIVEPERRADIVQSYVRMYEQGGWLPRCPRHPGYSHCMIGNHATSVIVDAWMKGFRDFDLEKAYAGMKKSALEYQPSYGGYRGLGTHPDYIDLGYVPGGTKNSVSVTLEYCYDDWCLAQLAKVLGKDANYQMFIQRAANYRNHFDPSLGFMRPRYKDGSWLEQFDPRSGDGFCESNSWQQTWFVPHDVQGLIDLMGGREKFVNKLNTYFEKGYHNQGNEPSFINPFLYDYAGAPWRTQEITNQLMETEYGIGPDGLCGNDDAGAMSAWYVFSTLGFYPICPGQNVYVICSPIFEKATIHLKSPYYSGGKFIIEARNVSAENKYIQSATLNDKPLDKPWFTYSELVNGGILSLVMGPEPNENWGNLPQSAPPSMTKGLP